MNKSTRAILTAVLTLILSTSIIFASGCGRQEERFMIDMDKYFYARSLQFEFQIVVRGEARNCMGSVMSRVQGDGRYLAPDPFYDELVFVHNQEQAQGFPDNVIVAWPRTETFIEGSDVNFSEGLIAGIHWAVNRSESDLLLFEVPIRPVVTLEEFGLTYPLAIEDLVDNWEKVYALWRALTSVERDSIPRAASRGGPRTE